ncbi:hypothetical protein BD293_2188 [Roseinatronobacter monicus]|uniref:Uncharacterized protein n=1 Tax=Roseinatronobacter monicus TaxID=393481 RepID=A0A543KEQ1_9RHOB|nr:hypothetical protein BD293_2188 [Roseinatronobacter monicus]
MRDIAEFGGGHIQPQKSHFFGPLPSTALQNSHFLVIIGS